MKKIFGMILLLAGLFIAPVFAAERYAVFPQFASGDGWSSTLFFANQGLTDDDAVTGIVVSFYRSNGTPLSVQFMVQSTLFTGTTYTFDLAKGASRMFKVIPHSTREVGYVVVKYPWTGSAVRATEVYRYKPGDVVLAEVGVPQQEQGEHFSFPVEINAAEGIDTTYALANPVDFNPGKSITQTLILNLIRQDGTIRDTKSVTLGPGEHIAEYIYQRFPGVGDFVGTMSISSPLSAGVLAVRQEKEAWGGIATDGGPILGPFEASGNVQYATESNDTPATGTLISGVRPLSRILNGTIDSNTDVDYFRFQGNAGDIISVVCSRDESLDNNYLDPVLKIFDSPSAVNPIGFNDQNGLAPQLYPINDSFIQMKLPATGTYYIKVYDYYGYGDANSGYWLDVKLP
jgi:hypothetical protein